MSIKHFLFCFCMSTVRRGEPSDLLSTIIREHHVVEVFYSTLSITPSLTSLMRSAYTYSLQCSGMGAILWTAVGFIFGSIYNFKGSPVILGRGWCSQMLNAVSP